MAGKGNRIRCPQCGGFGSSKNVDGLCKKCAKAKAEVEVKEEKPIIKEVCTKCGEPAYKYLDASGYHSWYCEFHYNEKIEEIENEIPMHIVRANVKPTNPFFKDKFVPTGKGVELIKEKYDLER